MLSNLQLMENFLVSARKYRPDTFDTVVGQPVITSTLKSAIRSGHLAHAYLFCGPRGVGKTTCARIFAKAINCSNPGADAEPCNNCNSCKTFNESKSFNIHELDAASNNSVDDIRNLIESVRILPQTGKYSVYIIDEVHMLSQSAFNAFLKTLEEPPAHAIFVLATTEKHKIIPTILSRCQIFDFNRIKVDDIVSYLKKIASKEGVAAEDEALQVIALKADGAMRDALTIFDQLVSFSQKSITYKNVIENLNVLDYDYFFRLTDCFINGDTVNALLIFNEILMKGFDALNFISGLAGHLRDVLVSHDPVTLQLLEAGESIKGKYLEQARRCDNEFLYKCLDILNQCEIQYKSSKNQRRHVEIALIRLCNASSEKKNNNDDVTAGKDVVLGNVAKEKKKDIFEIKNKVTGKDGTTTAFYTKPAEEIRNGKDSNKLNESKEPYFEKHKTVSIKNALKSLEKNDKENVPDLNNGKNNEIAPADKEYTNHEILPDFLVKCWMAYAESLYGTKPRISSALKNTVPIVKENRIIEISFSNQIQIDDFNQFAKNDLEKFLRRELQHPGIIIEVKLQSADTPVKKLYTAEEKLAYLAGKNPIVTKLKQELGLELE